MGGGTGGGGVWPLPCCGTPGNALGVVGNGGGTRALGVTCWPGPKGLDGSGMSSASSAGVVPGVDSLKPVFVTGSGAGGTKGAGAGAAG